MVISQTDDEHHEFIKMVCVCVCVRLLKCKVAKQQIRCGFARFNITLFWLLLYVDNDNTLYGSQLIDVFT